MGGPGNLEPAGYHGREEMFRVHSLVSVDRNRSRLYRSIICGGVWSLRAREGGRSSVSGSSAPRVAVPLSVRLGLRPMSAAASANTTDAPAPKPNSKPERVSLSMRQAQARGREMKAAAEAKSETYLASKTSVFIRPLRRDRYFSLSLSLSLSLLCTSLTVILKQ